MTAAAADGEGTAVLHARQSQASRGIDFIEQSTRSYSGHPCLSQQELSLTRAVCTPVSAGRMYVLRTHSTRK